MEYPRIKELLQDDSYVNKRKGPPSAVAAALCGEKRNGGLFCSCREQSKLLMPTKSENMMTNEKIVSFIRITAVII